ncbi:MAG: carboxylating nicotinate-nucleotide diphosphorylase [Desulfovibrionaceae bacterium]|nr:carboxylating nicotinate-nucleotide diphosphorylase [Desulfovibrionaceae bacterium]MDD4952136.1 carboxylating nicotinate-nucleotide diphosphorylase [Desulfovibrionaceae bacterium]
MTQTLFNDFFQAEARMFLLAAIRIALSEDGADLTSQGIFSDADTARAHITAKEPTVVAGLPIIPLVLEFGGRADRFEVHLNVDDGDRVRAGTMVAAIQGPARLLLKAERVMLNFLGHLSGIAELTSKYVRALGTGQTTLLDTRKTLPGLRYPEKYAVLVGGGRNHRKNLSEMLLVKDNHIDRAGGLTEAVARLRQAYPSGPALEVECRTLDEVREAVACSVDRIMLDNMDLETMTLALREIPEAIETEASGNVDLSNIAEIAAAGPDFVSVGRITHSAKSSDFSMSLDLLGSDNPAHCL